MLVLTRRLDQTITIGDPLSPQDAIEVTVIEVRGDQVRLGISAPRTTTVHRSGLRTALPGASVRLGCLLALCPFVCCPFDAKPFRAHCLIFCRGTHHAGHVYQLLPQAIPVNAPG